MARLRCRCAHSGRSPRGKSTNAKATSAVSSSGLRRFLFLGDRFAPAVESGEGKPVSSSTWLDAQHRYMAIAQRAVERPARHAVAATADIAATRRTRPRPTRQRGAAGADGAAADHLVAAQGRAGREPVRPSRTRLLRCGHSRQSVKPSKN